VGEILEKVLLGLGSVRALLALGCGSALRPLEVLASETMIGQPLVVVRWR